MGLFDDVLAKITKGRKLLPYQSVPEPETGWNNEYILVLIRYEVVSLKPFVKVWRHHQSNMFRYSFSDVFVSNTVYDNEEVAKQELDEFLLACGAILVDEKLASMI